MWKCVFRFTQEKNIRVFSFSISQYYLQQMIKWRVTIYKVNNPNPWCKERKGALHYYKRTKASCFQFTKRYCLVQFNNEKDPCNPRLFGVWTSWLFSQLQFTWLVPNRSRLLLFWSQTITAMVSCCVDTWDNWTKGTMFHAALKLALLIWFQPQDFFYM